MEAIKQTMGAQMTRVQETSNGLTTPTPLLQNFSGKANLNKTYLANVMLLVKKTVSLSNQPPLVESDLAERAKDWMEAIEQVIPLDRLPEAFRTALKNHASTFPINAFEILAAYKEIEAIETAEKLKTETEEKTLNRVAFCTEKHNHKSNDEAIQQYFVGGHWEWLPCVHCRQDAYWQRVKDIKSKIAVERNSRMFR